MSARILTAVFLLGMPAAARTDSPPSADEQAALIEAVRQKALDHSQSLTDFLCTQETRRSVAKAVSGREPVWKPQDTVVIRVSYFKQQEDYRATKVNEKRVDKTLQQVGGHWTSGEFGSFLKDFFTPSNQAKLRWLRWTMVEARRAAVLSLRIEQANSDFGTTSRRGLHRESFNWGLEGELTVDAETQQVYAVAFHAIDIPPKRPLTDLRVAITYGYRKIGEKEYLLPVQSESRIDIYGNAIKAETKFSDYRKFSSDADIKFEAPAQ
ncbi:MAG TPA: hypothetical protein VGL72_23735 [Bryobacteraceae bacterium]|jgi:hypothetical protein